MQTRNIIDDGFTLPGRIDPVAGLHEGLTFRFRPMLAEEFEEIEEAKEGMKARPGIHLVAKAIAKHVCEWSEVDENGKPRPINFENVRRLHSMLPRLYRIVAGRDASDLPDEESSTAEERSEYLDSLGEAPDVRLVESQGN